MEPTSPGCMAKECRIIREVEEEGWEEEECSVEVGEGGVAEEEAVEVVADSTIEVGRMAEEVEVVRGRSFPFLKSCARIMMVPRLITWPSSISRRLDIKAGLAEMLRLDGLRGPRIGINPAAVGGPLGRADF